MKNFTILTMITAVIIIASSFSNTEASQQILTMRVSEGFALTGGEILIAEPNEPVKDYGDLGSNRDNNLMTINKCLNLITSKGWKLGAVSCSSIGSAVNNVTPLVTIYTFTK